MQYLPLTHINDVVSTCHHVHDILHVDTIYITKEESRLFISLLQAMVNTCSDESLNSDPNIRVASFFDHEEVGSTSAQGADSAFLRNILTRLSAGGSPTAFEEAMVKSYLVSIK